MIDVISEFMLFYHLKIDNISSQLSMFKNIVNNLKNAKYIVLDYRDKQFEKYLIDFKKKVNDIKVYINLIFVINCVEKYFK